MAYTRQNKTGTSTQQDIVMTPVDTAKRIIEHFNPSGKVLEPCRGEGAFYDNFPDTCTKDWCEIREGKDFFDYDKKVDWIITNPPYSTFDAFLLKCFEVADNVVLFVPIAQKVFKSKKIDQEIMKYGGIKEIVHYGTGGQHGFPFGFVVGAVHYQRDYNGPITYIRRYK